MKIAAWICVMMAAAVAFAGEAVYRVTGPQVAIDHEVNGFTQSVVEEDDGSYTVRVSVPTLAVDSNGRGIGPADPNRLSAPPDFEIPSSLVPRLTPDLDPYERATEILRWVNRELDIDSEDVAPQDARSVLLRGRGRCSGVANATTALLIAAGFQARTISGLLVADSKVVPHRWVECFLPGAGWVPTDPAIGYWVLTPRHMVFADTVTTLPGVQIVQRPSPPASLPLLDRGPIRPDRGAELVCRIVGGGGKPHVAVLRNSGGEERRTVLDPEGRFSRLVPGNWIVEVVSGGQVVARQWLALGRGASHSVVFDLGRDGVS